MESTSDDESRAAAELIDWLVGQFPGVPPDSVRDIVNAAWAEFTGRPIRAFVPVLVERAPVTICAARLRTEQEPAAIWVEAGVHIWRSWVPFERVCGPGRGRPVAQDRK